MDLKDSEFTRPLCEHGRPRGRRFIARPLPAASRCGRGASLKALFIKSCHTGTVLFMTSKTRRNSEAFIFNP